MLQIIETHPTKTLADRARYALVQAQQLVDAAWLKVTGTPVEPSPEQTYEVMFTHDGEWVVAMFNPYAENVDVSSTDERIYDCGD